MEIRNNTSIFGYLQLANYSTADLANVTATANSLAFVDGVLNRYNGTSWNPVDTTSSLLDEDDFASDSATAAPTQQSVKAYVDNQVYTNIRFLNGTAATLESDDFRGNQHVIIFNVSANTTVTAETNYTFTNYNYASNNYSDTNSATRVFTPGQYFISLSDNNNRFNVIRTLEPNDSASVEARGGGTTLTKNYNVTAAAGTVFEFDASVIAPKFGYLSINAAANQITVLKAGRYRVKYVVSHTSTGQRASLEGFIAINGTDVGGLRPRSYIRNSAGHTSDVILDERLLDLSVDDNIQVFLKRASGSNVTNAINALNGSRLTVEWVSI